MPALRAGRDVVAVAPTGSGKTLAYAAPLLSAVPPRAGAPRALVLAPTRELAAQIARVCARLAAAARRPHRVAVLAANRPAAALNAAAAAADLVVATPMRLVAALDAAALDLAHVAHVVLDEADELFDDKFAAQVDTLLAACGAARPDRSRVHLFSATLPPRVELLAAALQRNPRKIVVRAGPWGGAAAVAGVAGLIEQAFTFVGGRGEQGKVLAVRALLRGGLRPPALVFVQSRDRAAELFRELVYDGVAVDALHAGRTQAARTTAVARFRAGEVWVLIATDVLARGLDFLGVNSVVNYDMPASATAYVHRIGRTGRNGRPGKAVTLFTEEDAPLLGPVLRVAKASGADVPEWGLRVAGRVRKDQVQRMVKRPPKRRQVGGPNRASLPTRHRKERSIEKQGRKRLREDDDGEAGGTEGEPDGQRRKKVRRKKGKGKRKAPEEEVELFDEASGGKET